MIRSFAYDKLPCVRVPDGDDKPSSGWSSIAKSILDQRSRQDSDLFVVALEMYTGVSDSVVTSLRQHLGEVEAVCSREALRPSHEREALVEPYLGGDDPVFGYLSPLVVDAFFEPGLRQALRARIEGSKGLVVVWGEGATLCCDPDLIVYFDMPRWEGQLRQRRGEAGNLWAENIGGSPGQLYKRSFFVDWRVLDRHKRALFDRCDFFVDTSQAEPKMVSGAAYRRALRHTATRPFRLMPFFDPGPWGGQWMRTTFGLPDGPPNYAWCFDCVPEENSLLLDFDGTVIETPAINLVFSCPEQLLGAEVFGIFGEEFPIRFDLLDTMGGGNLSLQVHPTTAYIRRTFGMPYTQDESYYILDAGSDGKVYLGLREDADVERFWQDLERAQSGEADFDADAYAAEWPAKKHDHFLIPAGTLHCSGQNSMVLEISATPYIFTFKLWDWGRLGMDGKPRPINIAHGRKVLDPTRRAGWVADELINRVEVIQDRPGVRIERTGLHAREFIDTHRYWLSQPVTVTNGGTVHVLNVVEGAGALVTSPDNLFEPFKVHYAETFVVPAGAGDFTLSPLGGPTCAILRANVDAARAAQLLSETEA